MTETMQTPRASRRMNFLAPKLQRSEPRNDDLDKTPRRLGADRRSETHLKSLPRNNVFVTNLERTSSPFDEEASQPDFRTSTPVWPTRSPSRQSNSSWRSFASESQLSHSRSIGSIYNALGWNNNRGMECEESRPASPSSIFGDILSGSAITPAAAWVIEQRLLSRTRSVESINTLADFEMITQPFPEGDFEPDSPLGQNTVTAKQALKLITRHGILEKSIDSEAVISAFRQYHDLSSDDYSNGGDSSVHMDMSESVQEDAEMDTILYPRVSRL